MKQKTIFTLTLALLAFGLFGSNPQQPKNYYQFGMGVWVFSPFQTQVYAMSYEHAINGKFAIGGSFSYFKEEYTIFYDMKAPGGLPFHDFVFGERFSHPWLIPEHISKAGVTNFPGNLENDEETFFGSYISYSLFDRNKSSVDIALGGGVIIYNISALYLSGSCGFSIDTDTVIGWNRIPQYHRGLSICGFFRTRFNYQVYGNLYTGGSLLLDYDFDMGGFPLKLTLNFGVKF